ncbi:MAG TPA: LysR family transcriptional regulator [Kofleriaceae bacterium]|nr:LysR family transcriptional regulator [Kofleriaceae bacterium]
MNIMAANLNLFVAFDALIAHGNVSRAARQVGVTQSAMSNSLRNLRALLGDPLFLRSSRGITPTPRARELAPPVREALRLLERTLGPVAFDPATSTRTFTLMASDYVEFVLLPRLVAHVAKRAPGVQLRMLPWGLQQVPDELARGDADLMLGFYDKVPAHHREELLFEERYACIVRKGHPRVRGRLTLATYVKLQHVMVTQSAGATSGIASGIDRALAALGHTRDVSLRVSHFLNVPTLVASTDYAAALSRRVAEPFAKLLPLQIFEPPLELRVSRVGMVWHESLDEDPAQRWLRAAVTQVCGQL